MEKNNEGQLSCACLDARKTLVVCNRVVTRKCQTCLAILRRVHNKLRLVAYIVLTRRLRQGRDVSRIIVDKIERRFMVQDGVYGNCALLTDLRCDAPLTRVKHVGVHFPGRALDIDQGALVEFIRWHNFQTIQLFGFLLFSLLIRCLAIDYNILKRYGHNQMKYVPREEKLRQKLIFQHHYNQQLWLNQLAFAFNS